MKTIKILFAIMVAFITIQSVNAQSDKLQRSIGIRTDNIKVSGLCSMDKKRIENAANSVDGIKSAVWDENSQVLTLKYNMFKKDASDNVQKKIAAVGNDTEKYVADDAAYSKLPDCCHYQRNKHDQSIII